MAVGQTPTLPSIKPFLQVIHSRKVPEEPKVLTHGLVRYINLPLCSWPLFILFLWSERPRGSHKTKLIARVCAHWQPMQVGTAQIWGFSTRVARFGWKLFQHGRFYVLNCFDMFVSWWSWILLTALRMTPGWLFDREVISPILFNPTDASFNKTAKGLGKEVLGDSLALPMRQSSQGCLGCKDSCTIYLMILTVLLYGGRRKYREEWVCDVPLGTSAKSGSFSSPKGKQPQNNSGWPGLLVVVAIIIWSAKAGPVSSTDEMTCCFRFVVNRLEDTLILEPYWAVVLGKSLFNTGAASK